MNLENQKDDITGSSVCWQERYLQSFNSG